MDKEKEAQLMAEVSIDSTAVELACLVIDETPGDNTWEKIKRSVYELMGAGLYPYQAIRATTLARYRMGHLG